MCYTYTQARLERERGDRAGALQTQKDEVERLRAAQVEQEKALSEQEAKLHLIATAQPARTRAPAPPAPPAAGASPRAPAPPTRAVDLSPVLAVIDAEARCLLVSTSGTAGTAATDTMPADDAASLSGGAKVAGDEAGEVPKVAGGEAGEVADAALLAVLQEDLCGSGVGAEGGGGSEQLVLRASTKLQRVLLELRRRLSLAGTGVSAVAVKLAPDTRAPAAPAGSPVSLLASAKFTSPQEQEETLTIATATEPLQEHVSVSAGLQSGAEQRDDRQQQQQPRAHPSGRVGADEGICTYTDEGICIYG